MICAEPFCRVNHSGREANSEADAHGNSVVTRPIPTGTEITQFYGYETIYSIVWKFPWIREVLSPSELNNEAFLFANAAEHPVVLEFLRRL